MMRRRAALKLQPLSSHFRVEAEAERHRTKTQGLCALTAAFNTQSSFKKYDVPLVDAALLLLLTLGRPSHFEIGKISF